MDQEQKQQDERMIRILSEDIEGKTKIYPGLTRIKGISWTLSNAIFLILKLDKTRKIGSLTDEELKKITDFIKNPKLPTYILNRRADLDTGEDKHLVGSDLDLQKEFDIKRLKKIKSYRGMRHSAGLPVRGQRTKGHFRAKGKSLGVKRKKK